MSLKDKSGDTLSANQIPLASMSSELYGPMLTAYYVPRVLYSLCLCFQILYSRHSMFPVPMFPVSIFVPKVLCSCVYVPRVLCSLHLTLLGFYVTSILGSHGLLRSPLLCSQNSPPEAFVPRVTCSECHFSWCLYS